MSGLADAIDLKSLHVEVTEQGGSPRQGYLACGIGDQIAFDTAALESFSSTNWRPDVFDALVVAAVVEFCDRKLARSVGNWGRAFRLRVPVHNVAHWRSRKVHGLLVAALEMLTGDSWEIEFIERTKPAEPPRQVELEFPRDAAAVIAYSEGMDSRAVAALEAQKLGSRLVRVRVGKKKPDMAREETAKRPFTRLPYKVDLRGDNAETSARSRGFKFGLVAGIAAFLTGAPEVVVPESGQGALAPSMIPVGQGYPDYRNHPSFTAKMAALVEAIFGHKVTYRFPRLWHTKAETLRAFVDLQGEEGSRWNETWSCWQNARQASVSGKKRQCGICAACLLRRMSVHAAGLVSPAENYVWERLDTVEFEDGAASAFQARGGESYREYALAGVLHLDDFAALEGSAEGSLVLRRAQAEISEAVGVSADEVSDGLSRLVRQHGREWRDFAASLGEQSFVRAWIDGS